MTLKTYLVHGLRLSSDRLLPDLRVAETGEAAIAIRHQPLEVPAKPDGAWIFTDATGAVWIDVPSGPAFQIVEGMRIFYDARSASAGVVDAYLLGRAMGCVLYQRGRFPLHASATEFGQGAALFLGDSGQGKSTLCQALIEADRPLFADDLCVLDAGRARAYPGVQRGKLCTDALAWFGMEAERLEPVDATGQKRFVRESRVSGSGGPLPICGIVVLTYGKELALRPVSRAQRLSLIARHNYIYPLIAELGTSQAFLEFAIEAARLPFFTLERPKGFDNLRATLDLLKKHFD